MERDNKKNSGNDNLLVFISLLLAVIFLLSDWLGGLGGVRNALAFVFEPITYQANNAGNAVGQYLDTFVQLGKFRQDYNNLKVQIYEQEAQYSDYQILKNENEALTQQINLGNKDAKYVMANTLRGDNINALLLDEGTNVGIKQGDVVTYGNVFIGIISQSDSRGSVVKLPTDASSHLEVIILKPDTTTGTLSSGVVSGSTNGIKIENISMNSDVANGDVVFINDTRVGGFLTLGYVVGLSDSASSTYKTADVSTVLDYDSLMKVFVKID
jgi:rod shape-determining protein MreC